MPDLLPWHDNEYRLHENGNDGTLRYLKPSDHHGPWRLVPGADKQSVLDRERARQDFCNSFVGSLRGKTVVLLAAGPMMRRMTPGILKHLGSREDIVLGCVNSVPAILKHICKANPKNLFNFIFGPDLTTLRWTRAKNGIPGSADKDWGWHFLGSKTTRIIAAGKYKHPWLPVRSSHEPSITLPNLYWCGCMAGAINYAVIGLSVPRPPKLCAGPSCDWPLVHASTPGAGKIVMVGVEHNNYGHAFTGDKRFSALWDSPRYQERLKSGDRNVDWRKGGYIKTAQLCKENGISIKNAAPWATVKYYEPCDFEDELDIPQALRVGITARGQPEGN